jgi:poly(hydroxyalkanoate) depolymerase family esterase
MTRLRITALAAGLAVVAGLVLAAPAQAAEGADRPGIHEGLTYQVHVPPQQADGAPLPVVVAIHGCTMTGSALNSMKDLTALNALADREGFLVVYPDQTILRNPLLCWNALKPEHQRRGVGEPALIAGMTEDVLQQYGGDRSRVHVLGASSGAGLAVIMGVTYPDVFATVTSMAGGEYAFDRVQADPDLTPADTAAFARAEMGPRARTVPLLVGQGDADTTVPPVMADRLVSQFAILDGVSDTPDVVEEIAPRTTHSSYGGGVIQKYLVHGMGHAWPGPGTGPYSDAAGPDMSQLFWDFARDRTL